MISKRRLSALCLMLSLPLLGCASRDSSPVQYSVRRTTASREALIESAEVVLLEMGYQIAERDLAAGVVRTRPVESGTGGLRAGDGLISSTAPSRRIIQVNVESGPDGGSVFCKASIQEQVSPAAAQMMQSARSSDEGIGQTAIDRDAATTLEQNTYWRTVSRDRALERRVLEAIEKRVLPTAGQPAGESPEAAPDVHRG